MASFVETHEADLVQHCMSSVTGSSARESPQELRSWFAYLFSELALMLHAGDVETFSLTPGYTAAALAHRSRRHRTTDTITDVVGDIGLICDGTCAVAIEKDYTFTTSEFRVLNMFVDGAVAQGVDAFAFDLANSGEKGAGLRDGWVGIELANATAVVKLSFAALRAGRVGIHSQSADLLEKGIERIEAVTQRLIETAVSA
jgi:hypothetical protein